MTPGRQITPLAEPRASAWTATTFAAAPWVACARALERSMSSADIWCLHEQDAARGGACTSAERLGVLGGRAKGPAQTVQPLAMGIAICTRSMPKIRRDWR